MHGDDLLYRFFDSGLKTDPEIFELVSVKLVTAVSVWLPLAAYRSWPILMPWVVRDPSCRGNARRGLPDQWSSPNSEGYLRDDNSLIKSVARSLEIDAPKGAPLRGAHMGSEFVASHIWRVVLTEGLASRSPMLNSFVTNLIWLNKSPSSAIAKGDQSSASWKAFHTPFIAAPRLHRGRTRSPNAPGK